MKYVGWVVGSILAIVLFFGALFGLGILDIEMYKFFGVKKADADRQIFKENKSHVEGMVADLAKYKFEYETEQDEIARKAIADMIRDRFANFDKEKIESYQLRAFLISIRGY